MTKEFSVVLSSAFLRKAYADRFQLGGMPTILLSLAVVLIAVADWVMHGFGWFPLTGVLVSMAYLLVRGLVWRRIGALIRHWETSQGSAPIDYRFSKEGLEAQSKLGTTKIRWSGVSGVEISDLQVQLKFGPTGSVTLPTDQVPKEALDFIRQSVSEQGKRVVDRRRKA